MLVGRSGELDANTPRKLLSTELPVVRIQPSVSSEGLPSLNGN